VSGAMKIDSSATPAPGRARCLARSPGSGRHGLRRGQGNLGAVKVPDARVDALARLYEPKKITYAEITFSDLGAGRRRARPRRAERDAQRRCAVPGAARVSDAAGAPGIRSPSLRGLETETLLADLELVEAAAWQTQQGSSSRELAFDA